MKVLTQSEWAEMLRQAEIEYLEDLDILGTSCNPANNEVPEGTPDDSVCVSDDTISQLHARADYLWQEAGMESRANALMNLTLYLEIELHGDETEGETKA